MVSVPKDKPVVMVVDDDPRVTKVIKKILSDYSVIEVTDPLTVENHLLYSDVKLVITDLQMPGRDGLSVLSALRLTKPEIPVIILTGHPTIDLAVEATKLGAAEFLSKPLKSGKLREVVEKHINWDKAISDKTMRLLERKALLAPDIYELHGDKLLLKDEIISNDTIPDGFVEAKFEYLVPGEPLPFAVFVQLYNKRTGHYYLRRICDKDKVLTSGIRHMLYKKELTSFFVLQEDYRAYLTYFSELKSSPRFRHQKVKDEKQLVLYGKAVETVTEILSSKLDNTMVRDSINLVDDIFRRMVKDPDTYEDMFKIFKKDNDIFTHSVNTCLYSVSFGKMLKLDDQIIKYLGLGALYHDLGMADISSDILKKREPLTTEDWKELKQHPIRGAEKLRAFSIFPAPSLRVVSEHHEEFSGKGYPFGLKGNQISRLAGIVKIVDKYDSMTTGKPFRKAFTPVDALKKILVEESSKTLRAITRKFIMFLGGTM